MAVLVFLIARAQNTLLFLIYVLLLFISCIENLLFTLFLSTDTKGYFAFSSPLHKKSTTKGCTFTKCDGGSSILYRDSSKPNWNPTSIVNWFVTQFRIRENTEFNLGRDSLTPLGLGLRGWSHAIRHQQFSKQTFIFTKFLHSIMQIYL